MMKLWIFDLDGTLINEQEYLFAGYLQFCQQLSSETTTVSKMHQWLCQDFKEKGRQQLLQRFQAHWKIEAPLPLFLKSLREAELPQGLQLLPIAKTLLSMINDQDPLCIFTNGNPQQQRNKLRQIQWPFPIKNSMTSIFANEVEPKPSNKALLPFLKEISPQVDSMIYFGDTLFDEDAAKKSNIPFYYVQDLEKLSLDELRKVIL